MNLALFDLYTSGHHLPYASRVKQALEAVSDHEVTFVTLAETDRCTELFTAEEIAYIDPPGSPLIEERQGTFAEVVEAKLAAFCAGDQIRQYDVVHFLYADDILGPLWRHAPTASNTRLIGELNGVFFHRGTVLRRPHIHQLFLWLLSSPARKIVDSVVPDRTTHEALWQDLYLYRCLRDRTFDRIVVHSREANDYLSKLNALESTAIEEVPYPAPDGFGHDISRAEARHRLNLPSDDSILLFFGVMRSEKGIDLLLEALRQYAGPTFTMVLAGPPAGIDEQEVKALASGSAVNVVYELQYIDTPELYYRAADAVVLPYPRQYGEERASQMFQEVCSSLHPVIVSDAGVLGRLTEQWDLGATYQRGSVESLVKTLATFANEGLSFSEERMQEYISHHSHTRIARTLCEIYSSTRASRTEPTVSSHTD